MLQNPKKKQVMRLLQRLNSHKENKAMRNLSDYMQAVRDELHTDLFPHESGYEENALERLTAAKKVIEQAEKFMEAKQ